MSTYATPIPGAPGYEQADALANRAYNNAMARYQQQRSQTLTRYGYTRGADGSLSVDPNNEYGQYQQMLRGEAGQNESLQRKQAGSGWDSGSGYLGAQTEDLQHAQGGEQQALGTSLTNDLTGLDQAEQDAAFTRDTALYQNQLDAARNAVNNNDFNPADYSSLDTPQYGDPSQVNPGGPIQGVKPPAKSVPKKVSAAAQSAAKKQMIAKVRARKKGGR